MSVRVGDLSFVSTLDNSDFQAKSLQDLKLIQLRLQLTGDTEGIEKYNDAFTKSANDQIALQDQLNKMLEDLKIKTQDVVDTLAQKSSGTVFSDSAAEVAAYNASLDGAAEGSLVATKSLAEYEAELIAVQDAIALTTQRNEAGTISSDLYADSIQLLTAKQQELIISIEGYNAAQIENAATTAKVSVAAEEEIGILGQLKARIDQLKISRINVGTLADLQAQNKALQEAEVEFAQYQNAGKAGFNEVGEAVEVTTTKAGKFEAAISRVTDLQTVGARVVTQFSRQIISLGVGFLSFAIGAKAIEALFDAISNLDIVTGRLNQFKQNIIAFDEVMKNADQSAGGQIASLNGLYDATQNVSLSMEKRLQAAQALREEFPSEFENSTNLAIVNGKLKTSYEELSQSIIDNAKSMAAQAKIAQLQGTIFDAQYQIDKNNIDKYNQLANARAAGDINLKTAPTFGGGRGGAVNQATQKTVGQTIVDNTNASNLLPAQTIQIAQNQQKFLTQYVLNVSDAAKKISDANAYLGVNLSKFNDDLKNANSETLLKFLQSQLQIKLDSLSPNDAQFATVKADLQRVDDLLKQYQVKATKTTATDPAIALLASQVKLNQDIDALKEKEAAKDKTRTEQESDAIIASYTAQYNAAVAQNTKLAQYRKEHPNSQTPAAKQLAPIDLNSITVNEQIALQAQVGKDAAEQQIIQVNAQKKLFNDYENFRITAGKEAADIIFGNDTKGFNSYLDYVKSQVPTEQDLNSADPATAARAKAMKQFTDSVLPQLYADELQKQTDHLKQLLINDQSWQQQRTALIQKTNDDVQLLNSKGLTTQAKQAQENLLSTLTSSDITGFENQAQFKKLFTDVTQLSTDSANIMIANAERQAAADLALGKITPDAYIKIENALTKLKGTLDDRVFDDLLAVGSGLTQIGQSFAGINQNFSTYITGLGSLVTGLGNVGKAYTQIQKDAGDAAKQQQDYINLISTGVNALVGLIGDIASASSARKKEAEDYYNSVIAYQNAYNIALDEQIKLQFQTNGNIFITNYAAELADAAKAFDAANEQYLQSVDQLNQGQAIVGQKNSISGSAIAGGAEKGAVLGATIASIGGPLTAFGGAVVGGVIGAIGGLFGGKTKTNVLAPLLVEYPDLIKKATDGTTTFNEALAKTLIANNQVSDSTKILLQNTINYYDEAQSSIDQINTALSSLADNLGSSLEDALVSAFENGTDAATAFGNSVSAVISNIIQQFLFEDIFGSKFDDLNAKLKATVLGGGGTADITADFVDFFKDAGPLVSQFEAGLQAAKDAGSLNGLNLFPSGTSSSPSTLSGQIQASITEDTADILAGTLKGIQLNTFTTNNILQGHTLSFSQLVAIADGQLTAALAIQINTKQTADNTGAMLTLLGAIKDNTGNTLAVDLRAAGKYGY